MLETSLRTYSCALKYALKKYKRDKEIVKLAVSINNDNIPREKRLISHDGRCLEFASDDLKNDEEIVSLSVMQSTQNLE